MNTANDICQKDDGKIFNFNYNIFVIIKDVWMKSSCLTQKYISYAFVQNSDDNRSSSKALQLTKINGFNIKLIKTFDVEKKYPVICIKNFTKVTTPESYTTNEVTSYLSTNKTTDIAEEVLKWCAISFVALCMIAGGFYLIKKRQVSLVILYKNCAFRKYNNL